MAIPSERSSTAQILQDSRYHRAALTAHPKTEHLVTPLKDAEDELRKARLATEHSEDERTGRLAVLLNVDFELDDLVRIVHLKVLIATSKERTHPLYRACFPNGLSALVGLRGTAQAREVKGLIGVLREQEPNIAKEHGAELERLADASVEAENEWRDSEAEVGRVFGLERIARAELIRQMHRSEGALLTVFPGQKRRVRAFFRPTRRRGAAPDTGAPESDESNAVE
jgi:hypothetical protein